MLPSERAVQDAKAQVRVMHRALVAKVGPVPSSNAVFPSYGRRLTCIHKQPVWVRRVNARTFAQR